MQMIIPLKLSFGDTIRVVAPACSLSILSNELQDIASSRFQELGLRLTFGKHTLEVDDERSSSVSSRVSDLHDAFRDENVKGIITVIGGYNSNQLLRSIDWDIIRSHPKVFCGYSDIAVLCNAMYAKAGLVTYYGPHYSTFGQKYHLEYTLQHFRKCLFQEEPVVVSPSTEWTDDHWYKDQENRDPVKNEGWWVIREGSAAGTTIGGNLCTFRLLQGTEYLPSFQDSILFLEDDDFGGDAAFYEFDRNLQSLSQLPGFRGVRGIVIGRFQKSSKVTYDRLKRALESKYELRDIPVLANVDFGHTDPKITFPIGGVAEFTASSSGSSLCITRH